jgi:hypothetical protein
VHVLDCEDNRVCEDSVLVCEDSVLDCEVLFLFLFLVRDVARDLVLVLDWVLDLRVNVFNEDGKRECRVVAAVAVVDGGYL